MPIVSQYKLLTSYADSMSDTIKLSSAELHNNKHPPAAAAAADDTTANFSL